MEGSLFTVPRGVAGPWQEEATKMHKMQSNAIYPIISDLFCIVAKSSTFEILVLCHFFELFKSLPTTLAPFNFNIQVASRHSMLQFEGSLSHKPRTKNTRKEHSKTFPLNNKHFPLLQRSTELRKSVSLIFALWKLNLTQPENKLLKIIGVSSCHQCHPFIFAPPSWSQMAAIVSKVQLALLVVAVALPHGLRMKPLLWCVV